MSRTGSTDIAKRSPVRTAALIVGVLFLIVGVLGFIPGITTDYDELEFAGHDSEAELLGLFQVSVLHNLVHLAFGVLGVLMSTTSALARLYLIAGGAVYLVLWLYGLIVDDDEDANFIPLNDADDWLHLCLGVGMIALGLLLPRDRSRR
jgi:arginine exporter protein ArgO